VFSVFICVLFQSTAINQPTSPSATMSSALRTAAPAAPGAVLWTRAT